VSATLSEPVLPKLTSLTEATLPDTWFPGKGRQGGSSVARGAYPVDTLGIETPPIDLLDADPHDLGYFALW